MSCVPKCALGTLSILFMAGCAQGKEWGTLTGRFVVNGEVQPQAASLQNAAPGIAVVDESLIVGPKGGLKNALIYLRTKNTDIASTYGATANDEVTVEIKNRRFERHVVFLRTSQTLKLINSDGMNHNPNLQPLINPGWNLVLPAGAIAKQRLSSEEPLPVKLGDSIQPWLNAWVLVRDSPYAAISADDGTFMIRELPVGEKMEFQVWQERVGGLKNIAFKGNSTDNKGRFKLVIKPGDNQLGDFVVPSTMLRK